MFSLFANAWLVCADSSGNLDVYINLGPYSYNTPAGWYAKLILPYMKFYSTPIYSADETIHAYTGPYPTD